MNIMDYNKDNIVKDKASTWKSFNKLTIYTNTSELMYLSVPLSRGRSPFLQKKLYEITRGTHILKNGQPWEEIKGYKSGVPQISFSNIGSRV